MSAHSHTNASAWKSSKFSVKLFINAFVFFLLFEEKHEVICFKETWKNTSHWSDNYFLDYFLFIFQLSSTIFHGYTPKGTPEKCQP